MKKLLLLATILISLTQTSKASHVLGGEMGWTCLNTGQYIFFMSTYRDCTGITYTYENEVIAIVGSPLPKDGSGRSFDKITMKPDSNRWIAERNGDTSPTCTNQYGSANTCANGDNGSVQQFFYRSDPFTMAGNPNRAGWKFYWESVCCRPGQIENVNTNGTMLLRAEMYRTKADKDPCTDSSPEFKSLPTTAVCRGYEFTYNSTAIDTDLDSLIYSWSRPINPPLGNPDTLSYNSGYAFYNPTPDASFDSRNIASSLDSISGLVKMAVYSGNTTKKYITVIQVDAYRDGDKIATVYREIPVSLFSCPTLPNGKVNNPPKVVINGDTTQEYSLEVTAGQAINIPIEVIDNDYWDSLNTKQQVLSLQPEGFLFSRDRKNPTPCSNVGFGIPPNLLLSPCAYLQNESPYLDLSTSPPKYILKDTASIKTQFVWQPNCNHLQKELGAAGTNESSYNFVFKVQDDHCPFPATSFPTLTVKLKDPIALTAPIMKGISVDLKGEITYQWVPPIDSAFTFEKYIVEEAKTIDGIPPPTPAIWNPYNTNLKDFQQERFDPNYAIFRNIIPTDPTSPRNILNKVQNRDWYMRMIAVSGCTNDVQSKPSDPVRIIELEAKGIIDSLNSGVKRVNLAWNSPKTDSATSYNYFQYESKTHYYVWQNDSVSLGGVADSANWYLRDSTLATEIDLASNVCSDYAAFRIEARDTVITWNQGSAFSAPVDSLDTLTYSTFSVIDTLYMYYGEPSVNRIRYNLLEADYPADSYQWIDCNADTLISNATQRNLLLSDTGTYAVAVQNGNCMDTSDCFNVPLSLDTAVIVYGNDTLKSLETFAQYQWYNCGTNSLISGANKQLFIPKDTGSYAVIISLFGYSDTSRCIPIFPVGIAERSSLRESISVFPNPTTGLVTIKLEGEFSNIQLHVRNIQGQLLKELSFKNDNNIQLELPNPSGIYFIQLTNSKGERANLKVVKQ